MLAPSAVRWFGFALAVGWLPACQGSDGRAGAGPALTTAQAGVRAPQLDEPLPGPEPQEIDLSKLGHVRGSADAPMQVIEFTDFGCGYCRKFHDETWPSLLQEYVDTGKIFWRTVQFNVGMFQNSQEAALAGECGFQQDRWDQIRVGLFESQREWKAAGPAEAMTIFKNVADRAGVDRAAFSSCMEERSVEEPVLVANALSRQLGVRGTPTFFVDGYPVSGAAPLEVFREFFDKLLAEVPAAPTG